MCTRSAAAISLKSPRRASDPRVIDGVEAGVGAVEQTAEFPYAAAAHAIDLGDQLHLVGFRDVCFRLPRLRAAPLQSIVIFVIAPIKASPPQRLMPMRGLCGRLAPMNACVSGGPESNAGPAKPPMYTYAKSAAFRRE